MDKKDYPEEVIQLDSEYIDVQSYVNYRKGTNDYTKTFSDIMEIVSKSGKTLQGVWKEYWTEISVGVETCEKDRQQVIRIHRNACPMRILWCSGHEYVSYDHSEHCSYSPNHYWKRYEE